MTESMAVELTEIRRSDVQIARYALHGLEDIIVGKNYFRFIAGRIQHDADLHIVSENAGRCNTVPQG